MVRRVAPAQAQFPWGINPAILGQYQGTLNPAYKPKTL